MKKRLILFSLGIFIFVVFVSFFLMAQTPIGPIQAKFQSSKQVFDKDGTLKSEQVTFEDYIQDSNGNSYRNIEIIVSSSGLRKSIKTIDLVREHRSYLIDEDNKRITISDGLPTSLGRNPPPPPDLEKRMYLGRPCAVITDSEIGIEIWIDTELGLWLYLHQEQSTLEGGKIVTIKRATQLTTDQEIDTSLFSTPDLSEYDVIYPNK